MQKKLCFITCLIVTFFFGEGRPVYEDLDAEISALNDEIEEEDLDDIGKILDEETTKPPKLTAKGTKKQNTATKGLKAKHNLKDLRRIYKLGAAHNQGSYNDKGVYANAKGFVGKGVAVTGNEDRKYRKGTKARGFHRVHHKDEYKKDKVIYEDDETSGVIKKVGAKGYGFKIGAGAGVNKGRYHQDRSKGAVGKKGYSDKGLADKEVTVYDNSQGFEATFDTEG